MSSLAEITALLRQKDSEKTGIEEGIAALKSLSVDGFVGKIRLELLEVNPSDGVSLSVAITEEDDESSAFSSSSFSWTVIKGVKEESVLLVKDKNVGVSIKAEQASAEAVAVAVVENTDNEETSEVVEEENSSVVVSKTFIGKFSASEIPEDMAYQFDLEAFAADDEKIVVTVKTSFDSIEQQLSSKRLELEQVQSSIAELKVAIKEVSLAKDRQSQPQSSSSSPAAGPVSAPKKATKKSGAGSKTAAGRDRKTKKKSAPVETVDDFEGADDEAVPSSSGFSLGVSGENVAAAGVFLLQTAFEKKGFVLFALAALGIFHYGDYASV